LGYAVNNDPRCKGEIAHVCPPKRVVKNCPSNEGGFLSLS